MHKLSDHLRKNNQLERLTRQFIQNYQLTPCFGVEIEFYLSANIDSIIFEQRLGIKVKQEKGKDQFEIDLPPSTNLTNYVDEINNVISKIKLVARSLKGEALLIAKPFQNDYGNSIHFHVNFLEIISTNQLHLMANSLCHFMLDTFLVFMPNEEDYLRIDHRFMTPTNISWGGNNRTTAIRIPEILPLRLEHRISSPMIEPYLAIFTILKLILLGFKNPININSLPKIYGNAYDSQYNLVKFPSSQTEASKLFNPDLLLRSI